VAQAPRGHAAPVLATAYSPDGKTFASAAADGTIKVWEAQTARPLPSPPARPGAVRALAYSPDGKLLAAGSGNSDKSDLLPADTAGLVRLWDVYAGAERPPFRPFSGEVRALAFLSGGKVLAVAGSEKGVHAVKLWDMASGQVRDTVPLSGAVNALAAAADGKMLAIGFDGGLRLRDTETNQNGPELPLPKGLKVERVFFVPDGTAVATSYSGGVILWDLRTRGARGAVIPGPLEPAAVALSPDGKRLALATSDYRLKIWDMDPRRERLLLDEHRGRVTALAFSPDGRLLVSGSQDQTVRLWKAE
jgi:WD40 repeat protein